MRRILAASLIVVLGIGCSDNSLGTPRKDAALPVGPDKYQEAIWCNAFSPTMLTELGSDGAPSTRLDMGSGRQESYCFWPEASTQAYFWEPTEDGQGAAQAQGEIEEEPVVDEIKGVGDEAIFVPPQCMVKVRMSNFVLVILGGVELENLGQQACRERLLTLAQDFIRQGF